MLKSLVVVTSLFGVSAVSAQDIPTRFGALKIGEEHMLLYKNRPLSPEIQGNNSLNVVGTYQQGSSDTVLIQDNGGTACPVQLYLVTTSASGVKSTPAFGTCADVNDVKSTADTITITMKGFAGIFDSKVVQKKAAKEKHVYIFKNGVLTENGKLVK